jgi:hypothetical protein
MGKINKTFSFPEGEEYKKRNREENERCFLKNKQKIKYHSFILLELIPLEKIEQLIFGLDKLYADAPLISKSRLNYREYLSNSHQRLFQRFSLYLPPIINSNLQGKGKWSSPGSIFYLIKDNIKSIYISIHKIMSSSVLLNIQICLNNKINKKINDIIYKYQDKTRDVIKTSKGEILRIYGPEKLKKKEIYQIRQEVHKEAVNFLIDFFQGDFFERSKENISVIPLIDLFSLEYPVKEDDILDWVNENRGFFSCFGVPIIPWLTFKYEHYLFCFEKEENIAFSNYVIFANRKIENNKMYPDIDSAIELDLNFCSFDLIAIERWVRVQENMVLDLNSSVSKEILKIQENKFHKAIEARKNFIKNIFSFKRFGIEYERNERRYDEYTFTSLKSSRNNEERIDLFKGLKEGIDSRIKNINSLIDSLAKQYETILNLKNLEFSKNMQISVFWLTIIIALLAAFQIAISIDPNIIGKIIEALINTIIAWG